MTHEDKNHESRLSSEEAEYLKTLASKDHSLRELLALRNRPYGRTSISLSSAQVRNLRERLMDRMDVVGYDENYSPNLEGRMLEALIDKFFLP